MALTITKSHVKRIADLIERGGFESAEDAARAVIEEAWGMYEDRAKWAIAGQIKWSGDKGYIDSTDDLHSRVIIGPFGTETQAGNAQAQLAYSAQSGEEFRVFRAEFWHGMPAGYYKERNEARKAKALADKSPFEQELSRRLAWFEEHPGALTYEPDPDVTAWDRAHRPSPNDAPSFD